MTNTINTRELILGILLEVTKEDNQEYFVSDIPDNEWEAVQNTMIQEIFSKIKSNY